jgi:hypothetical protein
MPSIHFNYGEWTYWEEYNPPTYVGAQKVTFDGERKLIVVNEGEISLDVKVDLYSNWKEWSLQRDNTKWLPAFSTLGGDPITDQTFVGDTYFLENGWRVQPWQPGTSGLSGYVLDIIGNLFTREAGENPINPVSGVTIVLTRSSINSVSIAGGTATLNRIQDIWRHMGLDYDNPQTITDTRIQTGNAIRVNITNPTRDTTLVEREEIEE